MHIRERERERGREEREVRSKTETATGNLFSLKRDGEIRVRLALVRFDLCAYFT